MVAVFNPLAATQLECGSVVMGDDGQPMTPALPAMAEVKALKDQTFKIMLTGYTRSLVTEDPIEVMVYLRNDRGDLISYPAEESHSLTPVDTSCVQDGCGYVLNKFVDVRVNEVDGPLFISGKHGVLRVSWNGTVQQYSFDVPKG